MSELKFQLNGVEELKRTLAELNSESALKVGTVAAREGAKMIRDEFRAAAPVGTEPTRKTRRTKRGQSVAYDYGRLRDNIRVNKLRATRAHQIRFGVGVGAAFWGLFKEFGTRNMPAEPWMRPAFDGIAPRVVEAVGRLLGTGITREAKRLGRKAKKLGL